MGLQTGMSGDGKVCRLIPSNDNASKDYTGLGATAGGRLEVAEITCTVAVPNTWHGSSYKAVCA